MNLDQLYQNYRRHISIESLYTEDSVFLSLLVPRAMVEDFQRITGQSRRNPVSFWKRMDFRTRLKPRLSRRGLHPDDIADYLGNVYAHFEEYPSQSLQRPRPCLLLVVEEKSIEVEM